MRNIKTNSIEKKDTLRRKMEKPLLQIGHSCTFRSSTHRQLMPSNTCTLLVGTPSSGVKEGSRVGGASPREASTSLRCCSSASSSYWASPIRFFSSRALLWISRGSISDRQNCSLGGHPQIPNPIKGRARGEKGHRYESVRPFLRLSIFFQFNFIFSYCEDLTNGIQLNQTTNSPVCRHQIFSSVLYFFLALLVLPIALHCFTNNDRLTLVVPYPSLIPFSSLEPK
jgi:hypothetical protein